MNHSIDKDKKPLFISFSAGETSAYMLQYLYKRYIGKREIFVLFANTGQEHEETYIFAKRIEEHFNIPIIWVEAIINPEYGKGVRHKIVDFDNADRTGKAFEDMIAKLGIPNSKAMFCTRELKERPMLHYLKAQGYKEQDFHTAIGIRLDEFDRIGKYFYHFLNLGSGKNILMLFGIRCLLD